ncbi:hypothetical protein EMMF5_005473 [Cystobasidiomycetes sp. EMM_F5]
MTPVDYLKGFAPNVLSPPAHETALALDALGGFFASLAFLQVVLLRLRPNDVGVWKCVQFAGVLVDVGVVGGFWRVLDRQGRLSLSAMRPEEKGQMIGTAVLGLVRLAFVLGVGIRKEPARPKRL